MDRIPSPLICITVQHIIDQPDAVEAFLAEHGAIVEKCLPLALMESIMVPVHIAMDTIPSIPDAKTTLEYLYALWYEIPKLGEKKHRSVVYEYIAGRGLTYLLPYIIERPGASTINSSILNAVRDNRIDTLKYLLTMRTPTQYLMDELLDLREGVRISSDAFIIVLDKMISPNLANITSILMGSRSPAMESPDVWNRLILRARKEMDAESYDEYLYNGAVTAQDMSNAIAFTAFATAGADLQRYHNSILQRAAGSNAREIIDLLLHPPLSSTGTPLWPSIDPNAGNAVYYAAYGGIGDSMKMLLDAKANIEDARRGAVEGQHPSILSILR